MRVLALGIAVAGANVLFGRWLGLGAFVRPGKREAAVQALGFLVRIGVLFSAAHLIWLSGRDPREVAAFIVFTGLLQMAAHLWLGGPVARRQDEPTERNREEVPPPMGVGTRPVEAGE